MDLKTCSKCKQEKEVSEFFKRSDRKSGYVSACKSCYGTYIRTTNKQAQAARSRKSLLKTNYGMTVDEYESLSASQEHCCAICGVTKDNAILGTGNHFHIDHNHQTGEVRGLLCLPCNTLLGKAMDNPTILKAAVSYLEERGFYG